jgi:chromosome transmission fidelity protein 1
MAFVSKYLQQMSDFTSQLFSHLPSSRIALFSCDHITPEANLRTLVLPRGPQGTELTFKLSNMENRDMVSSSSVLLFTPKYSDDFTVI